MNGADDAASDDGNMDHACDIGDDKPTMLAWNELKNAKNEHRAMSLLKLAEVVLVAEIDMVVCGHEQRAVEA